MKSGHPKYNLDPELINKLIDSGTQFVTGSYIAHAQLTLVERAYQAADLHAGRSLLIQPTFVQCARLWHVSQTYVHWAVKRPNDRLLVETGVVPLVPPPVKMLPAPNPAAMAAELIDTVGSIDAALDLLVAANGH